MPCINADGTLTPSARKVLEALRQPMTSEQLAEAAGLSLYRVRSSLREMEQAGLIALVEGVYRLTEQGASALQ